jgi:hypothetical protein
MRTCNETCNGLLEQPLQVAIAGGIAGPNMVRCRTPVPAANRKDSRHLYRVSVRSLEG